MPQEISLSPHVRGDSWLELAFEIIPNGSLLDLSGGASARLHVRRSKGSPTLPLEWTMEDGSITLTDPEAGKLAVAGRVVDLVPNIYCWDLELTLSDGRILTVAGATCVVVGQEARSMRAFYSRDPSRSILSDLSEALELESKEQRIPDSLVFLLSFLAMHPPQPVVLARAFRRLFIGVELVGQQSEPVRIGAGFRLASKKRGVRAERKIGFGDGK